MNNSILPIGTVAQFGEQKIMIAGYTYCEVDNKQCMQYIAIPYPSGLISAEEIKIVNYNAIEVISKGFDSKAYNILADYLRRVNEIASGVTAEAMKQNIREARLMNSERRSQ